MTDKPDLSKYFSDTSDPSGTFNQPFNFRQLSKNDEQSETDSAIIADEPTVCKLFQTPNTVASNNDAGRFFDMIGGSSISDSLIPSGFDKFKDTSPLNAVNLFPTIDAKPLPKPGRVTESERSRDAWIPSESTRRTLIAMVTSPAGTYTPDRDSLTMPGVVLEEDLKDTVLEAVNHYLGPAEGAKRKVLTASDVTQDDRGLRDLIEAGCFRAAVNLTRPLLAIYGQGSGRASHPSKHTAHSIQLWYIRLALLVKLRSFVLADVESEPFGDLEKPDLFFQFYPELYGGRMGSMVPFGFRLLLAQIPMYIEKQQICLTRLHKILATVRKMYSNLEKGLLEDGTPCDLSAESRQEALTIWGSRERSVLLSIVNCALTLKDYTLAIDVMQILLSRSPAAAEEAALRSSLGRVLLQLGDVMSAEKQFKAAQGIETTVSVHSLVDLGLLHVADNQYTEALQIFERAANIDPSNAMVISNMAVCLLYLGRLREAVSLLEKGLQSYPALTLHESYLNNLCNLYELQSTQCMNAKISLLSLVSRYRGDNFNISCLKLS